MKIIRKKGVIKNLLNLPAPVKKKLFGLRDFEGAYITATLVGKKKKVLNVGCLWGRENFFLTSLGKEVINLDLGKQKVPNLVIGDISKRTPFKDNEFDAIVMGEIIEHVFEDVRALEEIRRILKDDGCLVLTVPYFDDNPSYHVRMHSKRTIKRLLENCGFRVQEEVTRGGLISLSKLFVLPSLILKYLNKPLRVRYLMFLSELDYILGNKKPFLFKFSKSYGGYFLCTKGKNKDFVGVNTKSFIKRPNSLKD